MSDTNNDSATEIFNLRKQIEQNQVGIDGLLAQLDAHKELLNESLNSGLQLRTNTLIARKQNMLLTNKLAESQKVLDGVNKQLEDATKKIVELEGLAPATE